MVNISRQAARRGQNHRGAGRRYSEHDAATIRSRFSKWLASALAGAGISARALARALADDPSDHNRVSRTQVEQWLAGSRTVSAVSAYRAGEVLRRMGLAWSSGPLALYAAGHFAEFLISIRTISHFGTDLAREFAAGLLVYCEVLVEYDLAEGFKHGAPFVQKMTTFRPDIQKHIELASDLPGTIARIRSYLARACHRMDNKLSELESNLRRPVLRSERKFDRQFIDPAIGLIRSGAPLLIARIASRELLRYWSSELLEENNVDSGTPAMELWGDSVVVAFVGETKEELRASPLFDDRYLPEAVDLLRDTDLYARAFERRFAGS